MNQRLIIIVFLLLLLMISGVIHGLMFNRFTTSRSLDLMADAVPRIPMTLGSWDGHEVKSEDDEGMARNGVRAFCHRRYIHRETGAGIELLLLCGSQGPISVHTPDVCYVSSGYEAVGQIVSKLVTHANEKQTNYNVAKFRKKSDGITNELEIGWCWAASEGAWKAPRNPRFEFARYRGLYKIYAIRLITPFSSNSNVNPVQDFFRDALPIINQTLFQNAESGARESSPTSLLESDLNNPNERRRA